LNRLLLLGFSLLLTGIVDAQETQSQTLTLFSKIYGNTRDIRVILPPSYFQKFQTEKRYPVFYFTDGVAAWGMWGVPEVVEELWEDHKIPEMIFVGIDNGGSTQETENPVFDRASEYLPYPDQSWAAPAPDPKGKRFPSFLFDEVMPLIDNTYRTSPAREETGLAGDSYAAATVLYTAMNSTPKFGFLLLESPSLHIGEGRLLEEAASTASWPKNVYIGVGTEEGDTAEAQSEMVANAKRLYQIIDKSDKRPNLHLVVKEGGDHWYDAWRERLPHALEVLLVD
jgi:enterochelin esterase-like enzyme